MNTAKIKAYAPAARRDFIAAVTQRLNLLGIRADKQGKLQVEPATVTGSVLQIGGQTFDAKLARARERLVARAQSVGMTALVEQMAYTWFNRLCAIRFMELQGYLEHGFRVLSHPEQAKGFQVLDHVPEVAEALGLDAEYLVGLKLAGNQDEALFRAILLGQCHALHQAMPFLFEALEDDTELLLPDNLTRTDSLLRPLVDSIPASDWQQVEVIGWLYQFYIAERKDQVIGSVVKSEDIPAATQLFTPNWIVQYLVQNSIGRQWLQTYPQSGLQAQMPYYIAPAEQSAAVAAQLAALTPASLDPEALKVLDPACGSGHILVEAYKVLKAIYQERGYRDREIPQLILEKNLFGLDIDERAAQLAGFALLMLARADDRRIFTRNVKLNVVAMQASPAGLPALWRALNLRGDWQKGTSADLFGGGQMALGDAANDPVYPLLLTLVGLFREAKTFGSLIDVPAKLLVELQALRDTLEVLAERGDTMQQPAARALLPLVRQAIILAQRYDAVVANPPYMGSKGMNADLKTFAGKHFPNSKSDLFAMFMERAFGLLTANGYNAQVNMQSWMFLSSYEKLRESLLDTRTIMTMAHLGARAFGQISGEVVQTTAWVLAKAHLADYQPVFFRLIDGNEEEKQRALLARENRHSHTQQTDFNKIPGNPIAYWATNLQLSAFLKGKSLREIGDPKAGMSSTDNEQFVRLWTEVSLLDIELNCKDEKYCLVSNRRWYPYIKGGTYRKWFGNQEFILNWRRNGEDIRAFIAANPAKQVGGRIVNEDKFFKPVISWTRIATSEFSSRYYNDGFIFSDASNGIFPNEENIAKTQCFLNSKVAIVYLQMVSPTVNFQSGEIAKLPLIESAIGGSQAAKKFNSLIGNSKIDWDSFEGSWDFVGNPLLVAKRESVKLAFAAWQAENTAAVTEMQRLEEENNRLFIDAYGLQDELTPAVPLEQITLTVNPRYRYGGNATPAELEQRFQSDTCAELISYAIGCMMGRYRVDREGLVYAHSGNVDFRAIYEQGVRGEGLGVSEEGENSANGEKLPRPDCVAEVDGNGGAGLSDDQSISEGRTLRINQPDPTGSRISSIEHSGGTRPPINSRVSQLPFNSTGIESRSGNPDTDSSALGLRDTGAGQGNPDVAGRNLQNAVNATQKTNPSSLTPNPYFPPDDDGIIPLTDQEWFADDTTNRFREFVRVVWGEANVQENLDFVAQSLTQYALKPKRDESSLDTIRRYLSTQFYKDHLRTYKKRPIYWLFSSGKHKAFECLVYLHRYHAGTLARMRTEYVTPLLGKYSHYAAQLEQQEAAADSTADKSRLKKELAALEKQRAELRAFDDQLKHYADRRIMLDLDDGVKVNYGKFGELLAEVKAVTGGKE